MSPKAGFEVAEPHAVAGTEVVFGHQGARQLLQQLVLAGARVVLLRGPDGVGKRLLANYVARSLDSSVEIIELGCSTADIRHLLARCKSYPITRRVVILAADELTTDAATMLLKVLEEPPAQTWFILHAAGSVLPTVLSRSMVVTVGLLKDEEVMSFLRSRGIPPVRALKAAQLAAGRPGRALWLSDALRHRDIVSQLLVAVSRQDRGQLSSALRGFTPKDEQEWRESAETGVTSRLRQVQELLTVAVSELLLKRVRQPCLFSAAELDELAEFPEEALSQAIVLLGREVHPEVKVQAVVRLLLDAVEERRRSR